MDYLFLIIVVKLSDSTEESYKEIVYGPNY